MSGNQREGFEEAARRLHEVMAELYPDPAEAKARLAEMAARDALGTFRAEPSAQADEALTERSSPGNPETTEFEEFYRASYRDLVRTAMAVGATMEEAEDAVASTMANMLRAWQVPKSLAYARRAVVHNFIRDKTRGNRRIASRLIDRGHVPHQEVTEGSQLNAWEDDEWITLVLRALPPVQREVMSCIARGLDTNEVAHTLGMSTVAVRRHRAEARKRLAEYLGSRPPRQDPVHPVADSTRALRSGHVVNAMAAGALPDGTAVIVSGGSDRTVRMWRMADGVPLGRPLTGHTGNVNAVAVGTLRDGTAVIVSGGSDRTVRVWRMADGLSMGEPLTGHSDRVTAVAIAPDGTWLASAGDDQTVRIWDSALATGHRQRALAKPVEMTERPLGPTGN